MLPPKSIFIDQYRRYSNEHYLDRVREIEAQEIRINKRFVLLDSKSTANGNGTNGLKETLHRNMLPEEIVGNGRISTTLQSVPVPTVAAQSGFDRKVFPGSGNGSYTNT